MIKPAHSETRRLNVSPYLLLTGAVAASVAGVLQGAPPASGHSGHMGMTVLEGVTDHSGKMYDDITAGQCGEQGWTCYMTMTASIVVTGGQAVDQSVHDEIEDALDSWSDTDTTLYYSLVSDNVYRDVRFKEWDLGGPAAQTVLMNYHFDGCNVDGDAGHCEDTDETPPTASHQETHWWYTWVRIDDSLYNDSDLTAILAHELGHVVGLGHYPDPTEASRDYECNVDDPFSIMDYDCMVSSEAFIPKPIDECAVNHVDTPDPAVGPQMYGSGGTTGTDPHAWNECPGGAP